MPRPRKYPEELVARGVRLALESGRPIAQVAADLGMHPETLRKRVRQAEADSGARPELLSSAEREQIRRLRKENYELRRANEILKSASVFFLGLRSFEWKRSDLKPARLQAVLPLRRLLRVAQAPSAQIAGRGPASRRPLDRVRGGR